MSASVKNAWPEEYEQQGTENYKSKHENPPPPARTGSSKQTYTIIMDEEQIEPEEDEEIENKFQDRSRRMLFVRKVLATVGFQLLVCTCAMVAGFTIGPIREFFISDAGVILVIVCFVAWFILFIAIQCCRVGYGKPNPTNISLLLLSTGLLAVYSTGIVVHYKIMEISIAAAATVGTVFILAVITFHTKVDITGKFIYIIGAFLALFLFWFILAILMATGVITATNARILYMVLGSLFVVLIAVMILYDLQLIVGRGKVKYSENDWLRASISLFYDILLFFFQMLSLQGH